MTHDAPSIFEADLPAPEHFDSFHPFIKGVFSQWHPTSFQIDGLTVVTAEQWMMFSKARLFGDDGAANAILATDNPDEQKRFGQNVQGFHRIFGIAGKSASSIRATSQNSARTRARPADSSRQEPPCSLRQIRETGSGA
jgi:hypothetical protein